jgi:glycosyltransferase involved in cell wall biosynthesis
VTYYGKSPFFAEALRSATEQSLPASQYEVVVVTDQPLAEVEPESRAGGPDVRVVASHEECKGRFILDGIRACRGKVVSILNHDDIWEMSKLESVVHAFSENPGVGFYHNGLRWVDEKNIEKPEMAGYRRRGGSAGSSKLLTTPYPRTLGNYGLGFNDSSISFSREVVMVQAEFMEKVWAAEDTFLLYCAMIAGRGLYVDSRPLTRYRMHPGNSSVVAASDRESAIRALSREFDRRFETYQTILQMVGSTRARNIEPFVQRDIAVYALLKSLMGTCSVGTALSRSIEVLRHVSMTSPRVNAALVGIGGLRVFSPTLPRSLLISLGF